LLFVLLLVFVVCQLTTKNQKQNPGHHAGVALRILNAMPLTFINAGGTADTQGIDLGRILSDSLLLSLAQANSVFFWILDLFENLKSQIRQHRPFSGRVGY
jgi:hypothetical protein